MPVALRVLFPPPIPTLELFSSSSAYAGTSTKCPDTYPSLWSGTCCVVRIGGRESTPLGMKRHRGLRNTTRLHVGPMDATSDPPDMAQSNRKGLYGGVPRHGPDEIAVGVEEGAGREQRPA
eukprot:2080612-Rhodomonas_salina.2